MINLIFQEFLVLKLWVKKDQNTKIKSNYYKFSNKKKEITYYNEET